MLKDELTNSYYHGWDQQRAKLRLQHLRGSKADRGAGGEGSEVTSIQWTQKESISRQQKQTQKARTVCSAYECGPSVDRVGVCLRGEAPFEQENWEVKGLKAFSQKLQQHMDSFGLDSKHLFHVAPHKPIIILGLGYCPRRNIVVSCRGCCTCDHFADLMCTCTFLQGSNWHP